MTNDNRCIALVTEAFGATGGIAQYNRDFLRATAKSGLFNSITVLPRASTDPSEPTPGVVQLAMQSGRLDYSLRALRLVQSVQPRVIFCGHLYMASLAGLLARWVNAKLVMQMHGIEAWPRPSRLRRAAVEAADLVLCVSRYTRAAVLGWAAIAPERVSVVPNTVGEQFAPGDAKALRKQLGLDHKKILLTVGRMDSRERYKGHDRVIAALPLMIAEGHDVVYVIVGEGDDRTRLEALAANAGISDRLLFLGGFAMPRLVDAYRAADLFVMPSTGEGFGIAFLEAMACGTPAIGLAIAGAVDALADGELCTATSEAEFPVALSRLLAEPKCNSQALAAAVRRRFGEATFEANLRDALTPLVGRAA